MKRVLHINSYFFSNRLHYELVKKMSCNDIYQLVFIPLQRNEKTDKVNNSMNLDFFIDRCFSRFDRLIWPFKIIRIWNRLKPIFKKNSFDIIHAHSLFVNGTVAYFAYKASGVPYLITIRNTDINVFLKKSILFRWWGWVILKNASKVITLSHSYFDFHLKRYFNDRKFSVIKDKHIVIPNGAEDFWFDNIIKKQQPQKGLKVLFVGLIARNKNLDAVVKVCFELYREGLELELLVAGDGPRLNEFREMQYPFKITFFGHISDRSQLLDLYRKSDLLFVPSYTESFGIVYVEAMSQGLPVIYTANQGFDGFFNNGIVGYAVEPNDTTAMKMAVRNILTNYMEFSINAQNYADKFKWENSIKLLKPLYYN